MSERAKPSVAADGGRRAVRLRRVRPRAHGPAYFRGRGRGGAVLVAVLLALVLLAGLVFYVFNLGYAAQQRVAAQSAADAAAHGGGAWVARSMNQVALNNLNMARTIALVNILDAMPLAVEFTHVDQLSLERAIRSQQSRGIPDNFMRQDMDELLNDVRVGIVELEQMDTLLNGGTLDVRETTYYDGPVGRGHAWRAMQALDAANTATVEALADAALTTAIDAGLANLRESRGGAAMMLPAEAQIPVIRGDFDDFEPALGSDDYYGGLTRRAEQTARQDDWYLYRGPYDALFGWRHFPDRRVSQQFGRVGLVWLVVPDPDPDPNDVVRDYRVYGPQRWMLDWLGGHHNLVGSRFLFDDTEGDLVYATGFTWVNILSNVKLRYLWPGTGGATVNVNRPEWENDYETARTIASADPNRVRTTRLIVHVTSSRYPRSSGQWASDASTNSVISVQYPHGWQDPEGWNIDKVADDIWRDEWSYTTTGGLTTYWTVHYAFAGVDVGDVAVPVGNPHNFTDRSALPAPTDFDYARMPIDDLTRREYLTFLGVVRQGADSPLWGHRFDGASPRPRVALAQVSVFNNVSWDLWTPMWQAHLEPIEGYAAWVAQYRQDQSRLALEPQLADAPLGEIGDYLESLEPLVRTIGLEH